MATSNTYDKLRNNYDKLRNNYDELRENCEQASRISAKVMDDFLIPQMS